MTTIGSRLKKIRTSKNLSQSGLGELIGMSKSGISAVENDKVFISADSLRTLFFDLGVNLNFLICGEGQMFNPPKYEDVKGELESQVLDILKKQGLI